jgi:hypothetical protein
MYKSFSLAITLFLSVLLVSCGSTALLPTPKPTPTPKPIPALFSLDDFEVLGSPEAINCSSFGTESTVESLGFCIYYRKSEVTLFQALLEDASYGLQIAYVFPPDFGGWGSIRRETGTLTDLSAYSGIRLRLRVDEPADSILLRVTIADVASAADVGVKGRDELWWCENTDVLNSSVGEWQTVTCPFDKFVLANVGRGNNRRLDLASIVAYEISVVSEKDTGSKGTVVIDSLVAYK